MTYKGYTIEETEEFYRKQFMFYPTNEGEQHDGEYTENGFHYCGNCKWVDSIEEAKDSIDEKIMQEYPDWKVETFGKYPIGGNTQLNITKFTWLEDAVSFANKFNGKLTVNFLNP
jgi:hypothetical protein